MLIWTIKHYLVFYYALACIIDMILYDGMNMKFIVYSALLLSPLILLNYLVMPELNKMQDFYANIESHANNAAGVK